MKPTKHSMKAKAKPAGASKKKSAPSNTRTAAKKTTTASSKQRGMSMMDSDDRTHSGSRSSIMKDQSSRRLNAAGKNHADIDDEDVSPNRRAMTMAGKSAPTRRNR